MPAHPFVRYLLLQLTALLLAAQLYPLLPLLNAGFFRTFTLFLCCGFTLLLLIQYQATFYKRPEFGPLFGILAFGILFITSFGQQLNSHWSRDQNLASYSVRTPTKSSSKLMQSPGKYQRSVQTVLLRLPLDFLSQGGSSEAKLIAIESEGRMYPARGGVLLILSGQNHLQQDFGRSGTLLMLAKGHFGQIAPPVNNACFDRREWYASRGINKLFYVNRQNDYQTIAATPLKGIASLRAELETTIQHFIKDEQNAALLSAMLFGQRQNLDASVKRQFSQAGIMHLLAVSGLHVGFVYLMFKHLFKLLLAGLRPTTRRRLSLPLLLAAIWFYVLLCGSAPSVLRAALMLSIWEAGRLIPGKTSTYNVLAASAFLLLTFDPGLLESVGFQLSFSAVTGIVFLYPRLRKTIRFKSKIPDKAAALGAVSIAAQTATLPISLFYFHQFPLWFLPANMVAVPLAGLILYGGYALLISSFIPFVAVNIASVLSALLSFFNKVAHTSSALPTASGLQLFPDIPLILCIYATVVICALLHFFKPQLRRARLLSFSLIILLFPLWLNAHSYGTSQLVVHASRKAPVIDFVRGKLFWRIAPSDFDTNKYLLRDLHIWQKTHHLIPSIAENPLISGEPLKPQSPGMHVQKCLHLTPNKQGRTIIIAGQCGVEIPSCLPTREKATLIIPAWLSFREIQSWKRAATPNIKIYSCSEEGAFMKRIPKSGLMEYTWHEIQ